MLHIEEDALHQTESGLLVPEGAHEAAVDAALREHDPDLRLVPQDSDYYGRRIYKVAPYYAPDPPVEFLLTWCDPSGETAYPLSMAIVDEIRRHDRGMRGFDVPGPDVSNAKLL